MYDCEAIRAPSVARYALGVAVACERRATLLGKMYRTSVELVKIPSAVTLDIAKRRRGFSICLFVYLFL